MESENQTGAVLHDLNSRVLVLHGRSVWWWRRLMGDDGGKCVLEVEAKFLEHQIWTQQCWPMVS